MKFRYFVMHNHRIEHDFDLKLILYRVFTGQVQLHRKQSLFQNVNFSIFEFATLSKEFSKTRQSSKRERERDDDIRRMTSYLCKFIPLKVTYKEERYYYPRFNCFQIVHQLSQQLYNTRFDREKILIKAIPSSKLVSKRSL